MVEGVRSQGAPRWQQEFSAHALAAMLAALTHEGLARILLKDVERRLHVRASLTLLATQWLLQVVAALVCLGAAQLVVKKLGGRWLALAGYFCPLFAALTFPVAASLASGEWISQQPHVWVVRWLAPALGSLLAASAWAFLFSSYLLARRWLHVALCVLISALALLLSWANVSLLVGQYEPAHRLLMVLAALCAQWGLSQLIAGFVSAPPRALHLTLSSALALTLASLWLVRAPVAVVAQLMFKSPRAGTWVGQLAPLHQTHPIQDALARLEPSKATHDDPIAERSGWELPADWNVILLVVDTLRADPFIHGPGRHPKRRFRSSDAPFLNGLFSRSFTFERAYAGGNMTHISMPSMLRSRNAFDAYSQEGAGVAARAARLGRHSIAVVPGGLATRHLSWKVPSLLQDFAEVHTYLRKSHNDIRGLIVQALESGKQRPFFAWIHYMAMHAPGWAERSLASARGSHSRKYVQSLRWTDHEIEGLFAELEKQGLAQKTVVIVTADHGEGLGDNGVEFHAGPSLQEEVVRVPLAIYIPGRPGRRVAATVGNIDIVPTIVDLLGGSSSLSMRGRSLVPLLAGVSQDPLSSYYVESLEAQRVAAVRGERKYVLDLESGAWAHYNLAKDRWGRFPHFSPKPAEHQAITDQLTWLHPELFAADLAQAPTDTLLDKRLAESVASSASPRTAFLLDLVRLDPTPQRLAWARRVFENARTDDLRLQVLDRVYVADPVGLGALLEPHFATVLRSSREQAFVEQLADMKQQRFAPGVIAERLGELSAQDPAQWAPWLRLVATWPLPQAFNAPLTQMLTTLAAQPDAYPRLLTDALHAVGQLESRANLTEGLGAVCLRLTEHADPSVRGAAALAVANIRGPDAEAALRRLLDQGPTLVRVAALRGLGRLNGSAAIADIEQFGSVSGNNLHAIHLIEELGSPEGIPFLDRIIAERHDFVVDEARQIRAHLLTKTAAD